MSRAGQRAVRWIALAEGLKGVVVLLAASGLLALVHRDLNTLAAELVAHAHLNPASHYPHVFLDAVAQFPQSRLLWLAAGAAAYAGLRLAEAWGLWHGRAWAEWLAALSGGVYLPLEAIELLRKPTPVGAMLLVLNAAVVAVMALALLRRRRAAASDLGILRAGLRADSEE